MFIQSPCRHLSVVVVVNAARSDHRPGLLVLAAFTACSIFMTACSRDPHALLITSKDKEGFASLVASGKGLSADELVLRKDAESRAQKSHASDKVVGKTIGDVIADQRKWQADHDQLVGKLEPVYRSAKTIQGATSVGVNFAKYGELLQASATEINVANDKLSTDEERRVANLFKAAFQAYQDAGTCWQRQLREASQEYDKYLYGGGVGYTLGKREPAPEIKSLVETYHLAIHNGPGYQSVPKNSMQDIWVVADSKLGAAVDAYLAK